MRKLLVWIATSIVFTAVFFLKRGISLDKLSPAYIEKTGAYPYIVLSMCVILLFLKREQIIALMNIKTHLPYTIIGISLSALSMLIQVDEPPIQIFALLLLWLGIFTAFFGKASWIPLALLGIYGFALVFPPLVFRFGNFYPMATTTILVTLLSPLIPISNQGQTIHFLDVSGNTQNYFIDAGCSGSASLAIFLSLFFLMMLDAPLPWKKAGYMLIFGLAGTTLQNILRLVVLVFAGYWHGSETVWTAHTYAGYILFPAWYALFAYIYLKQKGAFN
ncbi:MAG: exosortase/archaeosortase family protein [Candidatus Methanoperedens sp.]|nr:exosortase/archaeosortase family protein [Candidatus Methanoperedens sp.]